MTDRTCSIDGCEEERHGRKWCQMHYVRMRTTGTTGPAESFHRKNCSITGCEGSHYGRGLCVKHHGRWKRTGDPNMLLGPYSATAEQSPKWRGDDVKNPAIHRRVTKQRGRAKDHVCIDCGNQAHHWSYDHTDPNERVDEQGPYGLDVEHYSPRCVPCHKRFDVDHIKSHQ